MVTAKKSAPAAKTTTPAASKKPGAAMVLWEAEMKAAAKQQSSVEKAWGGGGFGRISLTGGRMSIDGDYIAGDSLDVVIIASVHLNEYYATPFDSANPTVPACFAFGDEKLEDPEAEMRPIEADVDDVQLMDAEGEPTENCAGCWANQMGSADTGRGKACKNVRRLLVVTEDALESAEALTAAEVRSIGVPVMSVKNWVKYMNDVLGEELERPYYGVVTTISLVPDAKSQFKVQFEFKELVNFDQALWDAMKLKTAGAAKEIVAPYPHQADLDAAKAEKATPARGPGKGAPLKPVGKLAQSLNKSKPPVGKAAAAPAKKAPGKKY